MGILEKLRPSPRWKHADPTVRVAAIYELGPDESDVLHVLGREDGEARVRRAAAGRIDDVLVLGDIAKTDPDEDVRTEAVRGLAGIAAEADNPALAIDAVRQLLSLGRLKEIVLVARESSIAEVRAAVVDALDDQRSLGAISRHALDGVSRLHALGRLTDLEELLNVAVKAEHTDVAVAALERLSDPDAITLVSQRARSKVAARRARARLRLLEEASRPVVAEVRMGVEDRQRAVEVLHRAEALVAVADPEEARGGLTAVRLAWAELQADVEVDPALVQQFESASDAVREAIAQRDDERTAEVERARTVAREQADRVAICDAILTLSGSDAADRIAELKVRWDSLPPMPSEYAASLTRRFQDACRQFGERERRRLLADAAVGRLETLATELEQLMQSGLAPEEIVARWRGLRRDADVLREFGGANPAAAERVERAVAMLEEQEQQQSLARGKQEQDNLRRLHQICRQVEILAAADQITLKAADRALNDIRSALDARAPLPSKKDRQDIQTRLETARAALSPRAQELRDADEWQRWANLQVQETLCREMETLKTDRGPRRRQPADARAPGAMETGRARPSGAGRGHVASVQGGAGRGVRPHGCARRGAARSVRREPGQEGRVVRAGRGAVEFERLGANRDGDSGAPGGMEVHRAGHARARTGHVGTVSRGVRSLLHPPPGRSQTAQGTVDGESGQERGAVRQGGGARRLEGMGSRRGPDAGTSG